MNFDLTLSTLQSKGYRITKARKEIVRIFSQISTPLTANELKELLLKSGLFVNKSTIYRELQFLLDNGYLVEVFLHAKQVSYESSKLTHHHHLVCNDCGKVDNLENCPALGLEKDVYQKNGFKIERHNLEFYGTCANCSNIS